MITQVNNIPEELKKLKQWCVYSIVQPKKQGQHKGKIPINPITGKGASSTDSSTWVDFKIAFKFADKYDGLGFFFNDDYIGIDIDDIPEEIKKFKQSPTSPNNLINWLNGLINHSYLEVSQSGKGIHAIVKGKYDLSNNRRDNFEMYNHGRFFALTGDILNNQKNIKTINKKKFKELYTSTVGKNNKQNPVESKNSISHGNNLSTDEIVNKMYASSNGVKIKHLMNGEYDYNSQSEADIALCDYLAFWTNKDAAKMDTIFRQSKLMRDKWDRKDGAMTYGQRTINKAIADTTETFNSSRDATAKNVYGFNQDNKTIKQIKATLRSEGLEQRQLIKEQNIADGHPNKKVILNFRRVTSILEQHIIWAVVGNNSDDWQKSALYFYNPESGIYEKNNLLIDELINTVEPQITERNIKEVKSKLKIEGKRKLLTDNPNLYVLGNGIFDANQHKLLDYSPNFVFTSKIAVNYNPHAQEPKFDNWSFFNWINEDIAQGKKDKIKLIWQTFKAVINSNYSYHSAVFLLDDANGSAGKGTFEQLLENIAGENNYASIKLNEFEKDAVLATIVNKPLVIGDDNDPKKPIDSSERFKSSATGDPIVINDKYEKAYSYKPTCLIIQSLNDLPKFKDNSDATYRRIRVIKFNKHYTENANNRKVKDEYIFNKELLEWIVKKAINVKIDGVMTTTTESNAILKENQIESDPFLQFVNDIVIPNENGYRFQDTTYQAYRTWYKNTGHNIIYLESFRDFNKKMREHGFKQSRKTRDNHKLQVWLNIQLNTDSMNLTYMDLKDTKDTKDTNH